MRRPLIVLAVLVACLALPAATLAASPEHSSLRIDSDEPDIFGSCDGFDVVATRVHIERDALTWYDGATPLREQRQVHFDFVVVNSITGVEARYVGHFVGITDLVTGELTLLGAFRQLSIDHRNLWSATGRNVISIDDEMLVAVGSRSLFAWEAGLCDAMA